MGAPLSTVTTILMAALLIAGCGGESADSGDAPAPTPAVKETGVKETGNGDTPAAAIAGMLALAEAGDWEAYVSAYYGEKHKMTDPATQTTKIAARLVDAGPRLIELLKGCVDQAPTLSEDGNTAAYPNGFKLHRDDGKWGFHL